MQSLRSSRKYYFSLHQLVPTSLDTRNSQNPTGVGQGTVGHFEKMVCVNMLPSARKQVEELASPREALALTLLCWVVNCLLKLELNFLLAQPLLGPLGCRMISKTSILQPWYPYFWENWAMKEWLLQLAGRGCR